MEQKPDQEAMLAFTRQRVARLAGVSVEADKLADYVEGRIVDVVRRG